MDSFVVINLCCLRDVIWEPGEFELAYILGLLWLNVLAIKWSHQLGHSILPMNSLISILSICFIFILKNKWVIFWDFEKFPLLWKNDCISFLNFQTDQKLQHCKFELICFQSDITVGYLTFTKAFFCVIHVLESKLLACRITLGMDGHLFIVCEEVRGKVNFYLCENPLHKCTSLTCWLEDLLSLLLVVNVGCGSSF
jgi:hypothetical protein